MTTEAPETDPSQTSSTDQPNFPTTDPLVPITDNTIIPIAVGVSIAVLVLIIIGVIAIILIIYFVNRSKNRAWNPKSERFLQQIIVHIQKNACITAPPKFIFVTRRCMELLYTTNKCTIYLCNNDCPISFREYSAPFYYGKG